MALQLYIDHPDNPAPGHKFTGYYFTYPSEEKHLGLVSLISDDPPMLNWIFIDKDTGALRHGSRTDTMGHVVGPWYWSDDEQWLTLRGEGWNFIAVEEEETGKWQLCYAPVGDRDLEEPGDSLDGVEEDEEESEELEGVRRVRRPADPGSLGEGEGGEGDDEDEGEGTGHDSKGASRRGQRWVPIRLRRRLQLGMESRYVRDGDKR